MPQADFAVPPFPPSLSGEPVALFGRYPDMAHVLLVEDHPGLHRLLCDVLQQQGHTTECVFTRAEAEAALRGSRYDLVVSDIRLPDGTGHDVAALAASIGTKALLMSGHPDEIAKLAGTGIGHLRKPFRVRQFTDLINDHLGP
jgi:DNA-binding response OmpR family regulator